MVVLAVVVVRVVGLCVAVAGLAAAAFSMILMAMRTSLRVSLSLMWIVLCCCDSVPRVQEIWSVVSGSLADASES